MLDGEDPLVNPLLDRCGYVLVKEEDVEVEKKWERVQKAEERNQLVGIHIAKRRDVNNSAIYAFWFPKDEKFLCLQVGGIPVLFKGLDLGAVVRQEGDIVLDERFRDRSQWRHYCRGNEEKFVEKLTACLDVILGGERLWLTDEEMREQDELMGIDQEGEQKDAKSAKGKSRQEPSKGREVQD